MVAQNVFVVSAENTIGPTGIQELPWEMVRVGECMGSNSVEMLQQCGVYLHDHAHTLCTL